MTPRVVVVGGGVAGLTVAFRLVRGDPSVEVAVLEGAQEVGGRLRSVAVGDLELEAGPDSFVARKPWAVALCEELGLEMVAPRASAAQLWTERGLVDLPATALGVPAAPDDFARWPGLSRGGRLRALGDLVRKSHPREDDEALGSLLRRRLGDEATERLVAPLLAGLFAGDVDRLGVGATFPELAGWERTFGSLMRGAKAALKAAVEAGPMFLKPRAGVAALPGALAERLGDRVHRSTEASTIDRDGDAYVVTTAGGRAFVADRVVLATPPAASASILGSLEPRVAAALREIPAVSTAVVPLVYGAGTADAVPDVSGFVVPRERAPMTAATYLSRKWPDERFGDRAVVRCFVGADGSEDVIDEPDEDIVTAVTGHLAAVTSLPRVAAASAVVRWPKAMPQYGVGHLERVSRIEASLPPGIFVLGNAYRGVGVADTVHGANDLAERILSDTTGTEHRRTERVP